MLKKFKEYLKLILQNIAQLAGAEKYTDCVSIEA